jgi:glycine/D-amino acid oxidase-like deaminating enzyme
VGAGYTGLAAAIRLAETGRTVAVVDRNEPGWGASGRNGGQINPGLKFEPEQIETRFGRDKGKRLVDLAGSAPDQVFELIRRHHIDCEAERGGTLRAAYTPRSAVALERAVAGWRERGAPVELLDPDSMAITTGTGRYRRGFLDRRGGSLNPLSYARGLAQAAMDLGANVYSATTAHSLARDRSEWLVDTDRGRLRADWVVLATNAYTDDLWPRLRRSVVPVYSGIVCTEPLPASIASRILVGRPVVYESESIPVYYRLDASGRLLIGGRSRLTSLDRPGDFPELIRYATRLWPALRGARWTHGWNGQVAVTTDSYPHLHQLAPNLVAALGYNGRGVAMATAMGGQIARLVSGSRGDELDMPVTALKPIPMHVFWRIGVSLRILYGRLWSQMPI